MVHTDRYSHIYVPIGYGKGVSAKNVCPERYHLRCSCVGGVRVILVWKMGRYIVDRKFNGSGDFNGWIQRDMFALHLSTVGAPSSSALVVFVPSR